jgi:hypothetical protein
VGCNPLRILEFAAQSKRLRIDRMRMKRVVRPEGQLQKNHLIPAGKRIGIPNLVGATSGTPIGR